MLALSEERNGEASPRVMTVITEFLRHADSLFAVELQKCIFYGEFYCINVYGGTLTDAEYKPYMYGAYSQNIRNSIDRLEEEGKVETKAGMRKGKRDTRYVFSEPYCEQEWLGTVVSDIWRQASEYSLDDLTDFSKNNEAYWDAEDGETLDLSLLFDDSLSDADELPSDLQPIDEGMVKSDRPHSNPPTSQR